MKSILASVICSFLVILSSQKIFAHGCPVQPDESVVFDMGVDAQLFWQYGPDLGNQSVLFLELKRPGTAIPTSDQFTPEITLESPTGQNVSTPVITPVLSEAGQVKLGEYRIENLDFSSTGIWKMHIKLTHIHGFAETQSIMIDLCARSGFH